MAVKFDVLQQALVRALDNDSGKKRKCIFISVKKKKNVEEPMPQCRVANRTFIFPWPSLSLSARRTGLAQRFRRLQQSPVRALGIRACCVNETRK